MPHDRAQQVIAGRIGAHSVHARGRTNTGPANAAWLARFEHEVDPEGVLTPEEREKRAAHARSAYMTKLALRRWSRG